MSSSDKSEPNDFLEEADSVDRRAAFATLPDTRYVPGSVQERLELLFELKELAFALAGDKLDLRAVMPAGQFLL